jgi:hypothetical protein
MTKILNRARFYSQSRPTSSRSCLDKVKTDKEGFLIETHKIKVFFVLEAPQPTTKVCVRSSPSESRA